MKAPKRRQGTRKPIEEAKVGAWLPWREVQAACRIKLGPASRWQVLLAVWATSARYGGQEAWLMASSIAAMTELSLRTVKSALGDLTRMGFISRSARSGRLLVHLPAVEREERERSAKDAPLPHGAGASTVAPPRGMQGCTSPTGIMVSENKVVEGGTLTRRQRSLVRDVLAKASELLGSNAQDLTVPSKHLEHLGLPDGTTYGEAEAAIENSDNRRQAQAFVKAVLALNEDGRVQGEELT